MSWHDWLLALDLLIVESRKNFCIAYVQYVYSAVTSYCALTYFMCKYNLHCVFI